MASTVPYDTIRNFLATEFNGVYPVLDFDKVDDEIAGGTGPFITLEEVTGEESLVGFGDETNLCSRESGIIIVHSFVPADESSGLPASHAARSMSDTVRASLRHKIFGSVHIEQVQPPDLGVLNAGLWSAGASAINYSYDFHDSRY